MGNVLGDHGFAETLSCDEDDVFSRGDEVERECGLDGVSRNFLGPIPIEISDGFESTELAASGSSLQTPSRAVSLLEVCDVFEELTRGKALFCGVGNEVIELCSTQA